METNTSYVLITGGTMGIGYELAKIFAKSGHNLVIAARHDNDLERVAVELRQQYNIAVEKFAVDLFDPQNAFKLYDEIISKNLTIDILVNDAGQGQYGEFIHNDIHRELDIIQLNISSLVVLTKLFLKDMVERGSGKILNLSSIASKVPGPLHAVYHGTKAFVQSFTEAIREEVKDKGIVITALLPGATATDFFNKADMLNSKIIVEGDLADPADVAKDGYDALMDNDDMVVSGMKNKVQVALSGLVPDEVLAKKMHKQQEPVKSNNK